MFCVARSKSLPCACQTANATGVGANGRTCANAPGHWSLYPNRSMTALAQVAGDVAHTVDAGDAVAAGATLGRLIRVGERSLTAVWDQQDLSV